MRIAVTSLMFPAWTETFVRREVEALRDLGHDVRVFFGRPPEGPPAIGVEGVAGAPWERSYVSDFDPDVIYAELGYAAHLRAVELARTLKKPYALRLWSGLDAFALPEHCKQLYAGLGADPLCRAVVVEDAFMASWARNVVRVSCRTTCVPNSLFLDRFDVPARRVPGRVLSISRFVPKKGLAHLILSINLSPGAHLHLYGDGPEREALWKIKGPHVLFCGVAEERRLPEIYASASVYASPCVRGPGGDADGVPTTVLEAMASGCPVVASNLLSMPCYVADGQTGLLVDPGKPDALAMAIGAVLEDESLARSLGKNARAWARENLDVRKNILKIQEVLS